MLLKVVGATLVEWSESLEISVAWSLGHTKSISYRKTHRHGIQFWNKQHFCAFFQMEKRIFFTLFMWFLGVHYVPVFRNVSLTKCKLFPMWEVIRKGKMSVSPTKITTIISTKSLLYTHFRKICVMRVLGNSSASKRRSTIKTWN